MTDSSVDKVYDRRGEAGEAGTRELKNWNESCLSGTVAKGPRRWWWWVGGEATRRRTDRRYVLSFFILTLTLRNLFPPCCSYIACWLWPFTPFITCPCYLLAIHYWQFNASLLHSQCSLSVPTHCLFSCNPSTQVRVQPLHVQRDHASQIPIMAANGS